jgi:hypothetical protein
LLNHADLASDFDRQRPTPPVIDSHPRFNAERRALDLTRILFEFFGDEVADKSELLPRLSNLTRQLADIADQSSSIRDKWIEVNLQRNTLTNLFMANALLEDCLPDGDGLSLDYLGTDRGNAINYSNYYSAFIENLNIKNEKQLPVIVETRLVRAMRLYSTVKCGSLDSTMRRSLKSELDKFERSIHNTDKRAFVMPYDYKRFQFVIGMSRRWLEAQSHQLV